MSGESRTPVVVVVMPQQGHVQRTLPVIDALARLGHPVHVFTGAGFADVITQAGGRFEDLFAEGPLEAVDAESFPPPCRYVTFAAARPEAVAARVAALAPGLLIYDTFAVIGRVVAGMLTLPAVNLCAGHAMVPSRTVPAMSSEPRAKPSPACQAAATTLGDRYGLANATPFAWLDGVSPLLNLYAEPPEFLKAEDRGEFEPLAWFGSLLPRLLDGPMPDPFRPDGRLRVFVSFGSVVWRYYPVLAEARLIQVANELGAAGAQVLISTAGHTLTAGTQARLANAGARVEVWLDQRAALRAADVFITHHGLNSTHEAIWHGVPMLSMPFFTDQPALAARCQALGLALPLVEQAETALAPGVVTTRLAALQADRAGFVARLREARRWEEAVIAGRDAVVERMLALAEATDHPYLPSFSRRTRSHSPSC